MADDGLRFEAWTWPLVGTLTKKFDFTKWIDSYTINDRFNDLCDGTVTLSDDFPKKDQIFFIDEANHALDVGSMVRVLRGTTPIAHFLVTRSEDAWADGEPTHKLTLEGLEWILDRTTVPHYDYPADPTVEPDWIYGADTLLANAYLEDSPESKEVQHFYHTQGAGTYTITYSGQTTSALAFGASWFDVHQALEALSNIQDVVVTGAGTAASPFEIEFLDPSGNAALLTTTATGASIVSNTEGGVPDPAGWTKSFHPQTGEEHGEYTDFEVSADQNHTTAGTYSLKVVAAANSYPTDYPGVQQIQNVTGGRTYRGEIWVYSTTTADYRFILRTMDETAIDGAMVEQTVTANTWTKLTIPPFEVPQHISQVIFRLGLIGTGGGTFYVDDGVFAPGFPAAALGFIMNDLRTACLAQGTLGWITPTWTTTTDTDGAAWDQDLKWLVNHDQTILQLFEYMRQWNYEWRIRWDVADNRFEWDMWNPLGGGQTRANIAITGKSGVTQGNPIVKRPPGATYVRVEGELGRWGENASTTLDDVWGRLEKAVNDRQGVDSLQLDTFATRLVVREGTDTAGRAVTVEDPTILPWQAYEPGDTVTLNLAPKDTKQALRVVALVASMSPGQATPRYDVHFVSPILSNEAAMAQGLRTLWRKFNAFRPNTPAAKLEPPPPAGKGMPTVVVAASDSTELSKQKADLICTGTNDQITFRQAETLSGQWGRVQLTEGSYACVADQNPMVSAFNIIEGMGNTSTIITITGGSNGQVGFELNDGSELKNLQIDYAGSAATYRITHALGSNIDVHNLILFGSSGGGIGIFAQAARSRFRDLDISTNIGIDLDSGTSVEISGLYAECFDHAIRDVGFGDDLVIENSYLQSDNQTIELTGATRVRILANYLLSANDDCIDIVGGYGSIIGNHVILAGDIGIDIHTVSAGDTEAWVVVANTVNQASQHGIRLDGASDCMVASNTINEPGIGTDNTFDGIHLVGDSNRNSVQTNRIRSSTTSTENARYGINVSAAACDNNVVNGNVIGPSGDFGTGVFNDAGTGTQGTNFTV